MRLGRQHYMVHLLHSHIGQAQKIPDRGRSRVLPVSILQKQRVGECCVRLIPVGRTRLKMVHFFSLFSLDAVEVGLKLHMEVLEKKCNLVVQRPSMLESSVKDTPSSLTA